MTRAQIGRFALAVWFVALWILATVARCPKQPAF
jgi:type IV secretory pathway TrbD component